MKQLYLLMILMLFGCNDSQTGSVNIHDWEEYELMPPTSVIDMQDSDLLFGNSSSLEALVGDWIFIYDPYDGYLYSLLNLKTKEERRILVKGNAPGEFLQPTFIFEDKEHKQIKFHERGRGLFYTYRYQDVFKENFRSPVVIDSLNNYGNYATICGTDYIENEVLEDLKLFSLKNDAGKTIYRFGDYPGESIEDIDDPISVHMLAQARMIASPQGEVFVAAGRMSDWLAFYQMKNKQPTLIKEYFSIDVTAKLEKGANHTRLVKTDDTMTAYMRLYPTSKYLYAMYSGAYKGYRPPYRYIQVFDWNGNFIKGLRFSERLNSFVVDEEQGKLYGLSKTNDEPRIYIYSLQ
ncbi:MAG: hypothetical protein J6C87_08995 [Bacteroides sp.]|nr:hypothetical protein [Bacteroides sp.]